ncbi:MAG: hypothetical protein K8R07_09695 [Desulfobacterales bacterium]|nr:hypothetical protein [Desulfobacterales bacterium]
MTHLTEETLEQTTLAWFENLGYEIEYGPDIAFDGSKPERDKENHNKGRTLSTY